MNDKKHATGVRIAGRHCTAAAGCLPEPGARKGGGGPAVIPAPCFLSLAPPRKGDACAESEIGVRKQGGDLEIFDSKQMALVWFKTPTR